MFVQEELKWPLSSVRVLLHSLSKWSRTEPLVDHSNMNPRFSAVFSIDLHYINIST